MSKKREAAKRGERGGRRLRGGGSDAHTRACAPSHPLLCKQVVPVGWFARMLQNVQSNRLLSLVIPQLHLNCTMARHQDGCCRITSSSRFLGRQRQAKLLLPHHLKKSKVSIVFSRNNDMQPAETRSCTRVAAFTHADAQAMHIRRRSIHGVVMASRIFACSASARVCAAVMSHSDSVSGRGELNATTKG
jgi:hypothetical protein